MDSAQASPPLYGLVLAGGGSRRMGRDKGAIRLGGEPQVIGAWRLLCGVCDPVYVSINAAQRDIAPYADLPVIVDSGATHGPAAGLLAAWERFADVAWLVLAVDLPRVGPRVLEPLIDARDSRCAATVLRHADGTLEPLCTIWEPAARLALATEVAAGGNSLRRVLERSRIAVLDLVEPGVLASVNTPDQLAAFRAAHDRGRR